MPKTTSLSALLIRTASARPRLARALLPCLLAAALSAPPLTAFATQSLVQAAESSPPNAVPEPERDGSSPRAVMGAYTEAIVRYRQKGRERDLEAAVRELDLGDLPPLDRAYQGRRCANRLLDVLDRICEVQLEQFPAAQDLAPEQVAASVTLTRAEGARADGRPYAIELVFSKGDGRWRIAKETVGRIDAWWRELSSLPPLPGLERRSARLDSIRSLVPPRFQETAFLLEHWQWLALAALVLIGMALQRVVSFLFKAFLDRAVRRLNARLDKQLLTELGTPLAIGITSLAFVGGLPLLDLEEGAFHALNLAANFMLTVAAVWTAYRLVDVLSWYLSQKAALTENKFDDMLVPLLRRTLKIVVVVVGLVFIVTQNRSDLWGLVAGLSIGSLAIGFAAKDSIENLFGTFTVLMDKPFQLGDVIKLGEVEGAVEDVGFRSTRVRTPEDSIITIPNSKFIGSLVENRGARRYRRTKATIGLTYDTPPEKIEAFCEGVRELIREHPYTRKDQYHVWFSQFSASSLDVQLLFFFDTLDWATEQRERHRLLADILRLATRLKVSFAFPTQTIVLAQADGQHEDAPDSMPEGIAHGREVAREVARESLAPFGGERPAPVVFVPGDPAAAGHGRMSEVEAGEESEEAS
jgi:MscS family membrane protein